MASALYIHWPFCLKKCPYCDFNSHVRDEVDLDRWQGALISDMRYEAEYGGGEALESIFFGGGTPSLMPPKLVEALLLEAEKLWGFSPGIEITLEANPSSVEASNFAALAKAGVNRISIGIQSFEDDTLRFLGRLHSAKEGFEALAVAQRNFERVSFDLIYARPGQTPEAWEDELRRALAIGTEHLSLYQLMIESGTRFETDVRLKKFSPLEDDPAADLYAMTQEITEAAGLPAYEISNHARPGQESRHNLTYWRYQDYSGIGPGAHGRRQNKATERHKKPENYLDACKIAGNGIKGERDLASSEQAAESLLVGLRLAEGVNLSVIENRFGIPRDQMVDRDKSQLYANLGLFWQSGDRIGLTRQGMPLLDALLGELVHDTLVRV